MLAVAEDTTAVHVRCEELEPAFGHVKKGPLGVFMDAVYRDDTSLDGEVALADNRVSEVGRAVLPIGECLHHVAAFTHLFDPPKSGGELRGQFCIWYFGCCSAHNRLLIRIPRPGDGRVEPDIGAG